MAAPTVETPTEQSETQAYRASMTDWIGGLGTLDTPAATPAAPAAEPEKKKDAETSPATAPAAAPPTPPAKPAAPAAEAKAAPAPEKEAPEKKPAENETKSEADEEKWPRTSDDWDAFKKKRKDRESVLRREIETRDTQIKELTAKATAAEEAAKAAATQAPQEDPKTAEAITRLKAENDALTKKIMVLDVTQHDKFKSYFERLTKPQIALAKEIVGAEMADRVEKVLAVPDDPNFAQWKQDQIDGIMNELNENQRARFGPILNRLYEIRLEREEAIANAESLKQTEQANEKERTTLEQQQNAKAWEDAFNATVKAVTDEKLGSAVFQKKENDPEWNKAVDQRLAAARTFLSGKGLSRQDIVRAALNAAALPVVLQAYQTHMDQKDAEIAKLAAQVKEMSAAQPTQGGSPEKLPGDEAANATALRSSMTPMEASKAFFQSFKRSMEE